MDSPVNIQTII